MFPSDVGTPLTIGASPIDGEFDGIIDEVGLWNRALPLTEIKSIFETQSKVYRGNFESPVLDAGSVTSWESLSVETDRPALKPLATSSESSFAVGNFDASNLLLHLSLDGTLDDEVSTAPSAIMSQGVTSITGTAVNPNGSGSMKYVKGKISQGISFDGTDDHIVLENHPSLDITGTQITLMAWVKVSEECCDANMSRIISKSFDGGGNDVYALAITNANPKEASFRINGQITTGGQVSPNVWTHVAGVYDGNQRRLYVNGLLAGTPDTYTTTISSSAQPVHIGMRQSDTRYFAGSMDEVAIFDRELSASEIRAVFHRGKNQYKYQVRSCDDAACAGENYVGPDGSSSTYYSEASNFRTTVSSFGLSNLGSNRYIQFKAMMDEVDSVFPAKIMSVEIK